MKYQRLYVFSFVWLFLITVSGCDNKSKNTELNEANAILSKLTSENKKLQDQNRKLSQQREALLISKEELDEWTKKLVEGYGAGVWYIDESTRPIFIKPIQTGDIKEIIKELNLKFKQDGLPLIVLTNIKENLAYVRIDDAAYLTQRMGTHGSTSYINAVTYSLASVEQIDCVMFDFKEGDHAIPGKYCR